MSKVTDSVMNSIIRGCKAEARKQVKDEFDKALKYNKILRKDNTYLRRNLKDKEKKIRILENELKQTNDPLYKREKICEKREKSLRYIAASIIKEMQKNQGKL